MDRIVQLTYRVTNWNNAPFSGEVSLTPAGKQASMESRPDILIVDDDRSICLVLEEVLKDKYSAEVAHTGKDAEDAMSRKAFDLILVDLKLPDMSGFEVIKKIRERSHVGVIMLTGSLQIADTVTGLESGADDYLLKPFDPRELLARIRSVLRRKNGEVKTSRILFGGLSMDLVRRELTGQDQQLVELTTREFDLLTLFVQKANKVLTRDEISEVLVRRDWDPSDRSIDVTVSKLRKKIERAAKEPQMIKTVRGAGYVLASHLDYEDS